MGSLIGHIVPGTFFGLFAMWWTFDFLRVFFRCRLSGKPYRSNRRFADPHRRTAGRATLSGRIPPFEVVFKFVVVIIGILGEYFTGLDENWNFVQVHHGQHMTMFAFFWFASIFELMYFYKVAPNAMPAHLDLAAGALAFAVEGVLFLWHLDGRNKLDVQVHTFLVYSIVMCTAAMTLEIFVRNDVRVHLFRCFSVWLQGAWFFAVGFILYPPEGWDKWDPESHHHGMMVTMLFTWHAAGVMGSMMLLAGLTYRSVRRDLLRTKQRIYEDYCEGIDDDCDESRNNAADPNQPNGHVIKGEGSNGYTRLAQSDDSSVNLLLHEEDELTEN